MQHEKVQMLVFTLSLLISGITGLKAQETILASGGNVSGSGGSASYSVGQVVSTTDFGTTGSIARGVQQPYEISFITTIEQAKDIYLGCSAYPNPASDFLTLKIENYRIDNLSYMLSDVNGKLLENKKVEGNETSISMTNLLSGLYFLKIIDNQKEIKTFKIIKY